MRQESWEGRFVGAWWIRCDEAAMRVRAWATVKTISIEIRPAEIKLESS